MQRLGQAAHPSPGITHTTREKAQPQGGTRGTSHSREAGASPQPCWGGQNSPQRFRNAPGGSEGWLLPQAGAKKAIRDTTRATNSQG